MSGTKYSISAARITKRGRPTLRKMMKAGELAYDVNDKGNKEIDASELLRVFEDECDFYVETNKKASKKKTRRSELESGDGDKVDRMLHEQLVAQYRDQVDTLKDALDKAQAGQDRVTLLLERQTKDGSDLEATLQTMAEKVTNQTEEKLNRLTEKHDREIQMLKKALLAERNAIYPGAEHRDRSCVEVCRRDLPTVESVLEQLKLPCASFFA